MTKDELGSFLKDFLKENMTISISSSSEIGDFGQGDYQNYNSHKVIIYIGDDVICENSFTTS